MKRLNISIKLRADICDSRTVPLKNSNLHRRFNVSLHQWLSFNVSLHQWLWLLPLLHLLFSPIPVTVLHAARS